MEQFKNGTVADPHIPREINRGHLTLLEELGKGAFGVVWKALLKEEARRPGYLVAVKGLHESCSATDKQELLEEAAIMAQASQVKEGQNRAAPGWRHGTAVRWAYLGRARLPLLPVAILRLTLCLPLY